ncbi:MarR family winged helix-turn-helix transcriptional regulator [Methanococcus maripaludis]|nr:MarR family transcriptional regulator [Methanococcus maripaludis]
MYVSSREYLYQKIPKEDVLEFTMTDKKYLDTIRTLENPKITELANEMGYTKTSVTERINKLEKKGYVEKIRSESDKREVIVKLTERGHFMFKWRNEMHKCTLKEIENILSPEEIEIFERLSEKIGNSLEEKLEVKYSKNPELKKIMYSTWAINYTE